MAFSARPTSTDLLTRLFNKAAHGFVVGDIVRFNGTTFVKAQADIPGNCHSIAMVSIVPDVNSFYYSDTGFINGITALPAAPPFVAGTQYYLSTTVAGQLTSVAPSAIAQVVVPCFLAYSATSGEFISTAGTLIVPDALTPWVTVTTNTSMAINTNYWINSGGQLLMTLPVSMGTSDTIEVACPRAGGGFSIRQNASQYIDFIDKRTTVGVAGRIDLLTTSGVIGGSIRINCNTTDIGFMVTGATGNFDVI